MISNHLSLSRIECAPIKVLQSLEGKKMKWPLILLLLLGLAGCASNPTTNGQLLAKTTMFDPLFVSSVENLPVRVKFKSIAIMYKDTLPAFALIKDHLVITDRGVYLSEWEESSYTFKHKLVLNFSEIEKTEVSIIERAYLPNSETLEITTKVGTTFKFLILDQQANHAKSLIDSKSKM